jgi:hypothetical protein
VLLGREREISQHFTSYAPYVTSHLNIEMKGSVDLEWVLVACALRACGSYGRLAA